MIFVEFSVPMISVVVDGYTIVTGAHEYVLDNDVLGGIEIDTITPAGGTKSLNITERDIPALSC